MYVNIACAIQTVQPNIGGATKGQKKYKFGLFNGKHSSFFWAISFYYHCCLWDDILPFASPDIGYMLLFVSWCGYVYVCGGEFHSDTFLMNM